MPKPVLSDSLFNADDVATAVLAEANLQVANSSLGVTDISNVFDLNSSVWTHDPNSKHGFYFNGFVFFTAYFYASNVPASNTVIYSISNSDYRPHAVYNLPGTGWQGDSASRVEVRTNGDIVIKDPYEAVGNGYYITVNGWWRTTD